jgi:HEAT repeat protein
LLEAIAREHPEEALAAIEDLLKSLAPGNLSLLTAPLEALADERVIALVERVWPAASRERRAAVGYMILSFDTPSGARLSWLKDHFEELVPDQRRLAIDKFRESLHEPAIDLIGKALTDPSPEVREAARKAIAAFREHREALEEFRRWKTGDAEARASIAELMKLLESQNRDVVAGAAKALGALKAQAALPALVKLLERDDPAIKQAVEDAIAKIGE